MSETAKVQFDSKLGKMYDRHAFITMHAVLVFQY